VRYNEVKTTSESSYQLSAAIIESDINVNVSQPQTTFKSSAADECWERIITETKLVTSWYMNLLAKSMKSTIMVWVF